MSKKVTFTTPSGQTEADLSANPGNHQPFLVFYLYGPAAPSIFLTTTPGTADELRALADDLERMWTEHEARTYAEHATPPEVTPGDCAADARMSPDLPAPLDF